MDTAALILGQQDMAFEQVTCLVWKDEKGQPLKLWVRSLTSTERDAYEEGLQKEVTRHVRKKGRVRTERDRKLCLKEARAKLAAICTCRGNGDPTRIFSDEQVSALSNKNAADVDQLADVAMRLTRMTDADIEEEVKN